MDEEKKDNMIPISDLMEKLNKLDKLDSLPDWTLADYQNYIRILGLLQARVNTLENRINAILRNAPGLFR